MNNVIFLSLGQLTEVEKNHTVFNENEQTDLGEAKMQTSHCQSQFIFFISCFNMCNNSVYYFYQQVQLSQILII